MRALLSPRPRLPGHTGRAPRASRRTRFVAEAPRGGTPAAPGPREGRSGYRAAVGDRRGESSVPGTVLLLAASPVGRGRLVDAASVLPVLAAVPPPVLSATGTGTVNVIELADPLEPQAVLTRLR